MTKIILKFSIFILLLVPFTSFANEIIYFKNIWFGMNAKEMAEQVGGNAKDGCFSLLTKRGSGDVGSSWSYGGIDRWDARCVEDFSEEDRVPNTSGLYELHALVNTEYGSGGIGKSYSVDNLVKVFSTVFGKFQVKTQIFRNGLGEKFVKKTATATHRGAIIKIMDDLEGDNHEDYIHVTITSLDYLSREKYWEKQKEKNKLNGAKSDF